MSVTKDTKTNKWMAQIRVKDWTGKEIHKKKRGFETKREALQWERDFLNQNEGSLGMTFQDFIELYMKDMSQRLKRFMYFSINRGSGNSGVIERLKELQPGLTVAAEYSLDAMQSNESATEEFNAWLDSPGK